MFGLSCTLVVVGLTTCLNHLSWASPFLCVTRSRDHGWSDSSDTRWWKLDVPCVKCQDHVTFELGIICANCYQIRESFRPCQYACCARCFTKHDLDTFEVAIPQDFNGAYLAEVEDKVWFQQACSGNHLCTPFQCPNCQCQNIRENDLDPNAAEDADF